MINFSTSQLIMQQSDSLKESFSSLRNFPGIAVVKDVHSRCVVVSDHLAHLIGLKSYDLYEEQSDYDVPCNTSSLADTFVQCDQEAISKKREVLTLDICEYISGWKALLSSKKPIHHVNGDVTGVFGQAIDITNSSMFKWCLSLMATDHKIAGSSSEQKIYMLNSECASLQLTSRQQSFLFWLIRRKSVKEIASILNISVRTAEEHSAAIKTRLMCNSRSQVIEKAINSGFLNFIPGDVLGSAPKN